MIWPRIVGMCSCGEMFDGNESAEAQLAMLEKVAPEMVEAMRANEGTPSGVCAQSWWMEHMKRVPEKARSQHDLTLQVRP